jgi:hypothetical protein
MSTGVLLLAGSTCPETHPPTGFDGPRLTTDSAYIRLFQANPDSFDFDFHRIPVSDREEQFLGDFSTYGEISDHYAEIAQAYGGVTPLGSGPPAIGGYPLGLDIRFDAFSFARPQLANAMFYQMLVVNNSAAVYGQGVDYDSLYMGVGPGWGGAQANAVYYVPSRNALLTHQNGNNNGCNGAIDLGASTPNCVANGGFRRLTDGALAISVLKSPIGDARNRKLSQVGGPFYNPTSPFADDTITFNHGHMCGFGVQCFSSTHDVNDRRGFGMISSTNANVLDGRDPATMDPNEQYITFRSKNFTGVATAAGARFNTWVPGGWDYDNDGNPDTLHLDSCSDNNCVTTWSDTMPGKFVNRFSNVGGVLTVGPFELAAGDTTSFLLAFIGAPDSVGIESAVNDAMDAYMNFFVGPQPPPVPRIVAVDVASSQQRAVIDSGPKLTIYFSDEPENFTDPFLEKFAADLRNESNAFFRNLNRLNPDLADEVEARAEQNLAELWIFKSCDLGQTFTADADCDGDPTVGPTGALIGVGWQPYEILRAGPDGSIPNTFTDDDVIGGKTYLYSLVTRSRGFRASVRDIDASGDTITRELVVADTASSSLPRSGPNTIRVYVPISLPAGAQTATATVTTVGGTANLPVTVNLTNRAVAGDYRLVFANRFIVTIATNSATGAVTSTVTAQDVIAQAEQGGVQQTNFVVSSQTFVGPGRVDFSGVTPSFTTATSGDITTETDTISQFGFVLVQDQLGAPARPFFISTTLTPTGATPVAFQSRADFPGIFIALNQARADSLVFERIIQPSGDTVPVSVMDVNAVQFQQGSSTRLRAGRYEFTFQQDAFGAGAPFTLQATTQETQALVTASLTGRPVATTGSTDANLQSLSPYGAAPLVPMKFPFTVTTSTGNQLILAAVAREDQGTASTILLGSSADTQRVVLPDDVWVPGDELLVFEVVQRDSTVGGRTVIGTTTGQPIQVTDTVLAFNPAVLGCNTPRVTCNPLRFGTRGATGYLPYRSGWKLVLDYPLAFTMASEVLLDVEALRPRPDVLARSDLSRIRVVPNPYVFQSDFDLLLSTGRGDPRLLFTGVPATGTLRIYSVSGQFLQQLTWTEADLNGTGDLPYNLLTREGTELASGLYIYVITASGASGGTQTARGKFVVIR